MKLWTRLWSASREWRGRGSRFGLSGLLLLGACQPGEPEQTSGMAASRPNVVVYLVDALRPDRLGTYGSSAQVSPRIDAFAREAVVFESAWAQSSWTKAAVGSLFTGVWPPKHGANRHPDALPKEAETLAEILQSNGFSTAALSANPNITEAYGFAQGFDLFRYYGKGRKRSTVLQAELPEILDQMAAPFFLYVHSVDPHTPYAPPEVFRSRHAEGVDDLMLGGNQTLFDLEAGRLEASERLIGDLSALYEAEVAANDHSFGQMLDLLRDRQLTEDTLVVLVSDHGEELYDHEGWTHGKELYSESVAIPLLIRIPGRAGSRITTPVQQVDLLPTLLELLGLEAEGDSDGQSLVPILGQAATALPARPVFSYLHLSGAPRAMVIDGDWKLIERYPADESVQRWLFNLRSDPEERTNRALSDLAVTERMSQLLAGKLAEPGFLRTGLSQPASAEAGEDLLNDLRDLGYLQ